MPERLNNLVPLPARGGDADQLGGRSDDELMALCAAGLSAAFDHLVVRHERGLRAFCARLLGSQALGDDVAQEVCLEIWRTRERYRAQGQFRSFLFRAARNRCLTALRQRRPEPASATAALAALEPGGDGALDQLLAEERRRRLLALVTRLPARLREAVWLRYAAELEYAEIAAIVGRPVGTVRSRVLFALRQLRRLHRKERS
jgi:RNA polymerase sigma-70 factor (ECF subfamily)